MEKTVRVRRARGPRDGASRLWQHLAEGQQQAHRIQARQIFGRHSPAIHECLLVFICSSQIRSQLVRDVIVETQVGGGKSLFQDCHSREQARRLPFRLVRRRQQDFPISRKKCSCDSAHHVLRKSNRSILERELNGRPVQRGAPHLIHLCRIKSNLPEL